MARHKRKRGSKARAQVSHALRRFKERFGITLYEHQYHDFIKQIQRGDAEFIDRQSHRVSRFWVKLDDQRFAVAYDKERQTIVTVLKPEWVAGDAGASSQ